MECFLTPYLHNNAFIFPIYKATNQCRFILGYLITSNYLQQHKPCLYFRQLLTKLKPVISLLLGNFKQAQVRVHQTCVKDDRKHAVFLLMITTFLRKKIIFFYATASLLLFFQNDILTELCHVHTFIGLWKKSWPECFMYLIS